jgi:hypothetical protein
MNPPVRKFNKRERWINLKKKVKCFYCKASGHYANTCWYNPHCKFYKGDNDYRLIQIAHYKTWRNLRSERKQERQRELSKQSKDPGIPNVECFICHNFGHFMRDCWLNQRNKSRLERHCQRINYNKTNPIWHEYKTRLTRSQLFHQPSEPERKSTIMSDSEMKWDGNFNSEEIEHNRIWF